MPGTSGCPARSVETGPRYGRIGPSETSKPRCRLRGGRSAKLLAVFHRAHAFATRRNAAATVSSDRLERVTSEIVACRKCPRLVRYREQVARTKRAAFHDWDYWGRPVPGFGDPDARVLVIGLAPAALGAVAMGAFLRTWRALGHDVPSPVPSFRHGDSWQLVPITLVASYHPSQRNTQTGRLTQPMFDRVFESVGKIIPHRP